MLINNINIKIDFGMWMTNKPRAYKRKYWFDREKHHAIPLYPNPRIIKYLDYCVSKMQKLYNNFGDLVMKKGITEPIIEFTLATFEHPIAGHCEVATVCSLKDNFVGSKAIDILKHRITVIFEEMNGFTPERWIESDELSIYNSVYIDRLHKNKDILKNRINNIE